MRKIKVILTLVILALAGLTAWAYFGEYTPPATGMSVPVTVPGPDGN